CAGDRPNALATTAQIIGALSRAGLPAAPVIAYLKSESVGAVMSMSEDALVANLRALVRAETEIEGKLNQLQVDLRPDDPDQLAAIERLALGQAARLEELAATARELRRKIERRQGTNGRNGRAGRCAPPTQRPPTAPNSYPSATSVAASGARAGACRAASSP